MNFLYTIIIFPLVQIIELCYLFVYRVSHNPGIALFGVSMAVSALTLPLYFRAEKWQETERNMQKRMAPKIAKIKTVFSGDEQYMILSTYYRQNHYHPVYAMRNTFSLLIQIPFFIAAYSYLSHLGVLEGSSFLFIRDLGAPDALLKAGKISINILPVMMTAINCVSGAIYTKGFALRDKVQLYGMALIFLVLLYNSPAGLVLYWTLNNVFSLFKNVLVKIKHAKQWVYGILFSGTALFDIYVLFFHPGDLPKRLLVFAIFSCVFLIPLIIKIPSWTVRKFGERSVTRDMQYGRRCFILSALILLVLTGLIIPGSLIASSVEEFSFEASTSPFSFILSTILQFTGIFIFWNISIYFLFPKSIQKILTFFMTILSIWAFINVFLVSDNYGFLTNVFIFSEPKAFMDNIKGYIINLIILVVAAVITLYIMLTGRRKLLFSFQAIVLISLLCFGIVTIVKIQNDYTALQIQIKNDNFKNIDTHFTFSKTGKNVLLIMLDAAVSGYVPYIFEEKPELTSTFSGFTWYPNCVSFSNHTLVGAPPLYGGYEYTPVEINRRDSVPLVEKHKEAFLLLPRLFSENGYSATVTDPPFDNYRIPSKLSIFADYPEIHADNIIGKYTSQWLNAYPDIKNFNIADMLYTNLFRFSIFKISPFFIRFFIYDDGDWLSTANLTGKNVPNTKLTDAFIHNYALMNLLPDLSTIIDEGNTYTAFYSLLTHEPTILQIPQYIPSDNVANSEKGSIAPQFTNDSRYHVNIASFLLLERFFQFLKNEGVYDNTRIILVSDHGRGLSDYESNILLPDGSHLQSYHPLLMVKDFYTENEIPDTAYTGKLKTDNTFMTNADTVFFALKDIVEDPVNPFTGKKLQSGKENGVDIVTIDALSSHRHTRYRYNIGKNNWLHVHTNIFDPANWKKAEL